MGYKLAEFSPFLLNVFLLFCYEKVFLSADLKHTSARIKLCIFSLLSNYFYDFYDWKELTESTVLIKHAKFINSGCLSDLKLPKAISLYTTIGKIYNVIR